MISSEQLFNQALKLIPGGVNSPVRAFKGVGGHPIFFQKAKGAYLTDVEGQDYIDYVGSWGPLILGHSHPKIIWAVEQVLHSGMSFGAPTELELALAEKIIALMPSIEQVRMVNSGTEATMTAIRLARGFTKRDKIIKFSGCYHGHSDSLLVKAGSGLSTLGMPSSEGVPANVVEHTLVADFNDLSQVACLFEQHAIAAIIVEPVAGNMNLILPQADFLSGLRQLCDDNQALLIFDEVMTGFRVALGGAQAIYQIKPDITTLGKIIGGGMPVGAIGGRAEVMAHLAPVGQVYQAGTLSGNPLAMAAGLATLTELERPNFYQTLTETTNTLVNILNQAAHQSKLKFHAHSLGGMFGFYFKDKIAHNYYQISQASLALFQKFFHAMLAQGVYFAPSMYEAGFVSIAHGTEELQKTKQAIKRVMKQLSTDE